MEIRNRNNILIRIRNPLLSFTIAMFKPDEAACLLAERFNMIGWIYKQEPMGAFKSAKQLACSPSD